MSSPNSSALRHQAVPARPMPMSVVIASVLGLGLLAGALYLSPTESVIAVAVVGVGLLLVFVVRSRPELGLLLLVLLSSGLVPVEIIDVRLPVGGGLDLRDLVLLGMLGLLGVRGLLFKRLRLPWPPVSVPLVLFLGLALFSAVYALVYQGVEPNWVLAELRAEGYLLVFFITAWVVVSRRELGITLIGLYLIADITAAIVILQQFLGVKHAFLAAMSSSSWQLWQQAATSSGFGAVRVISPGHVLMYFVMIVSLCLVIFSPRKPHLRIAFVLQFLYLNIALLLTYTRSQWIGAAVAVGLVIVVLVRAHKIQAIRYMVVGSLVLLLGYVLVGTQVDDQMEQMPFVNTVTARAISIVSLSDTLHSYSLQWRRFEAEQAVRSISEHPILGVGLGNSYRDITTLQGEATGKFSRGSLAAGELSRFTRFVHSSFLSIATKMGLPALMVFLWFSAVFIVKAWHVHRRLSDPLLKGIVLAMLAGYVGLLQWALFHELLVVLHGAALVGLTTGLVASIQDMEGYSLVPCGSNILSQRSAMGVMKSDESGKA